MITAIQYDVGQQAVQGAINAVAFENLTAGAITSASSAITGDVVVISTVAGVHVEFGAAATTSSMVLPAGVHFIRITSGQTVNVLRLAAATADHVLSVITPR